MYAAGAEITSWKRRAQASMTGSAYLVAESDLIKSKSGQREKFLIFMTILSMTCLYEVEVWSKLDTKPASDLGLVESLDVQKDETK